MKKLRVGLGKRSYNIYIGAENLQRLGSKLNQLFSSSQKILLATDENVNDLYASYLQEILEDFNFSVNKKVVEPGEPAKSLEVAEIFYDLLIENNFARDSIIISLGGGVIGDLAGFVAATFMRGINLIQVPTSLLAQVDSSVGGKVAVNHVNGKNLIGAFYQPRLVFIDVSVLKTLPEREFNAGMAEVIKHGFGLDKDYFHYIENHREEIISLDYNTLNSLIKRSCQLKKKIVEEDEKEQGARAKLNLGHTIAHALETADNYNKFNHGEAVALGMVVEAYLAKNEGMLKQSAIDRLINLLQKFSLPVSLPERVSGLELLAIMQSDKKIRKGQIRFALPQKIGETAIYEGWKREKLLKAIKQAARAGQ